MILDKEIEIEGAGPATVLMPAMSSPAPCATDSLCDGRASNVILVRASHVTIHDLTIDGDNPDLTSGVVRGGADIDARNGIITDHRAGTWDGLEVYHVSARNIYLRGIYPSSRGTFSIHDNRVHNVQGDPSAIAIFNFGGAGAMFDNFVSESEAALSSNYSRGVFYWHNRIVGCGSGIHTDNAGSSEGSSPDWIDQNDISDCHADGYGLWAFVPSMPPTFRGNRVHGCAVGVALFGGDTAYGTSLIENTIDGANLSTAVGVYVTTDQLGYGSGDAKLVMRGNLIRNNQVGVQIAQQAPSESHLTATCNAIMGNDVGIATASPRTELHANAIGRNAVGLDATALDATAPETPVDARGNWWGCNAGPSDPRCNAAIGPVETTPVLSAPPECAGHSPWQAAQSAWPKAFPKETGLHHQSRPERPLGARQ